MYRAILQRKELHSGRTLGVCRGFPPVLSMVFISTGMQGNHLSLGKNDPNSLVGTIFEDHVGVDKVLFSTCREENLITEEHWLQYKEGSYLSKRGKINTLD